MTDFLPAGTRIMVVTHDFDPDIYGRRGTIEMTLPLRSYPYHVRLDGAGPGAEDTILFLREWFTPVRD